MTFCNMCDGCNRHFVLPETIQDVFVHIGTDNYKMDLCERCLIRFKELIKDSCKVYYSCHAEI